MEAYNNVQFIDLFILEDIQRLQDLFSDATGVASIITNPDGTPITNPSNFSRLCNDIIRKTEIGCANCYKSDAEIGKQHSSGPILQPCLSGGLWDGGASITVGGKHIANWLIGQVRNNEVDEKRMARYADEIGADKADFMKALTEVPIMSIEQFNKVSKMLFAFVSELSEKAYTNFHLKIQIAERKEAEILLKEKNRQIKIQKDQHILINKELIFQNEEKGKRAKELTIAKERAEESDKLKTSFLNNISHEIRTPFNGILGFLAILEDNDLTPDERAEYTEVINKSAFRLMNTINDIVEISQIQAGQIKLSISETNIRKLTNGVYNHFKTEAESKGLKFFIKNDLPHTIENIYLDNIKLNSILTILTGNAIKFTNEGSIGFEIKLTDKIDKQIQFSIKDTGIGIPDNKQQAIFKRFIQADGSNTRQFEGSGIGLSIANAYVKMLGGEIWVTSEEENGAEFSFTIPYYNEMPETNTLKEPEKADVIEDQPEIPGLKILIAEDDEISGKLIEIGVKIFGAEVINATTGEEAVDICRANPDIDFVLMDIKMPIMNGYEATRQIREFNKDVIIIAQTAYAIKSEKEKAIAAGCNDYISKPFNQVSLTSLMKKYLKK